MIYFFVRDSGGSHVHFAAPQDALMAKTVEAIGERVGSWTGLTFVDYNPRVRVHILRREEVSK